MGLSGTTSTRKPGPQKVARRGAALNTILDQLDQEWDTLKQDAVNVPDSALLAYYHACLRPALHWIAGDPYTWQPPAEYAQERLSKMCEWLRGLEHAERDQVKQAREQMLGNLRGCWPAYQELNQIAEGTVWPADYCWLTEEVPPFSFEGLETLWQGQSWEGDGPAVFLPAFRYKASADFHLSALALLFLNRQLRYYLTDLQPHADVDGRN